MIHILTKECDFKIGNLHYKKIHNAVTVVNKCCTVEPVLSSHPRGMAKWPLNTGCTKYRSEDSENAILYHS